MIRIEQLRLRLPPALAPHAVDIGRQLATRIGEILVAQHTADPKRLAAAIERIDLGALTVPPDASGAAIAEAAAQQLTRQLEAHS